MILNFDYLDKTFMCFFDGMLYQPSTLSHLLNEASYNDMNEFTDIKWLMWTGINDDDDNMVFEGDICLFDGKYTGVVRFERGTFYTDTFSDFDPLFKMKSIKRLGNFFVNPELQDDWEETV